MVLHYQIKRLLVLLLLLVSSSKVDKASTSVETPCTVKNDAKHMTDVFPVVFHDATVEPASDAAKYILTSSK